MSDTPTMTMISRALMLAFLALATLALTTMTSTLAHAQEGGDGTDVSLDVETDTPVPEGGDTGAGPGGETDVSLDVETDTPAPEGGDRDVTLEDDTEAAVPEGGVAAGAGGSAGWAPSWILFAGGLTLVAALLGRRRRLHAAE